MLDDAASRDPVAKSRSKITSISAEPSFAGYWSELWSYRDLFLTLAWRDVSVQYKQAAIGALWVLVKPLITVVVFSGIFGGVASLPSDGEVPYPLLVLCGTLPWFLISSIVANSSQSLLQNQALITKIFFPRMLLPLSAACIGLVDFIVTLLLFVGMCALLGFMPDWRIVFLPTFIILALLVGLGPAILLSALTVRYRDFRFIVPFLVQFGLYISPVGFSSSVIPADWRLLYSMNPVVGVIDGFRWSMLAGQAPLDITALIFSIGISILTAILGIYIFRRTEKTFADVV